MCQPKQGAFSGRVEAYRRLLAKLRSVDTCGICSIHLRPLFPFRNGCKELTSTSATKPRLSRMFFVPLAFTCGAATARWCGAGKGVSEVPTRMEEVVEAKLGAVCLWGVTSLWSCRARPRSSPFARLRSIYLSRPN